MMARIVFADCNRAYDGESLRAGSLGGAETAAIGLLEALAARGHEVSAHTAIERRIEFEGVRWAPFAEGLPERPDLYIANRGSRMIDALPSAGNTVFWIHNPARYLLKWRFLSRLWRVRPIIVFSGRYHAEGYPRWAPDGGRAIIPYGISETFRTATPAATPPPPRAIFTSNPRRGLEWLVELWSRAIRPRVPGAELHVYAGAAVYGGVEPEIDAVMERVRAAAAEGVVLREPVGKSALAAALAGARVMLYRGDVGETFCLSVAEAQALGLPAVVQPIGSLGERVIHGETGFVEADDASFAERAVALLSDDHLWRRQQAAALEKQRAWSWDSAAAAFEAFLPEQGSGR